MRISVTTFDIEPEELAAMKSALGLDVIEARTIHILERINAMAANFDALNTAIEEHNNSVSEVGTALTDALARIEADVAALKEAANDEADQAAVNAAAESLSTSTSSLRAAVEQLNAVDPVPPVEEPTEPTEPPVNDLR